MKTRPIIFSAPMVRALLDGSKTQTRRVLKPQPAMNGKWMEWRNGKGVLITEQNTAWHPFDKGFRSAVEQYPHFCPYGQPGDRLWVREAWRSSKVADELKPSQLVGGLSNSPVWYEAQDEVPLHPSKFGKLRPSMFMPRWASRITLEITGVRVERLQDISDDDAWAEGIDFEAYTAAGGCKDAPRAAYSALWQDINGPGSWDANPFVWVITFRRIDHA